MIKTWSPLSFLSAEVSHGNMEFFKSKFLLSWLCSAAGTYKLSMILAACRYLCFTQDTELVLWCDILHCHLLRGVLLLGHTATNIPQGKHFTPQQLFSRDVSKFTLKLFQDPAKYEMTLLQMPWLFRHL